MRPGRLQTGLRRIASLWFTGSLFDLRLLETGVLQQVVRLNEGGEKCRGDNGGGEMQNSHALFLAEPGGAVQ